MCIRDSSLFFSLIFFILFLLCFTSCEDPETYAFDDLYTEEVKELFDELDPCEDVVQNGLVISKVPIDESRRQESRPYQIANISNGQDTYYLFGRYKTETEVEDEVILAIDTEDGRFRNIYHFSSPLSMLGEYDFPNGSSYLQVFSYDIERERLQPRVVELAYINTTTLFDPGYSCLLYTSPSPRDATLSRMPSSA